ncbi:hypothetical protein [Rhizobium laguerreae]|uniref:hypothetical protein n=2 Tax=Rhizobium TaxID=379 RepID=UPI001C924428|nr:hypothetical protein [Rhizobium laguerreae]
MAAKASLPLDKAEVDRMSAEKITLEGAVADLKKRRSQISRLSRRVDEVEERARRAERAARSFSQEVETLSASKAALQPKTAQ